MAYDTVEVGQIQEEWLARTSGTSRACTATIRKNLPGAGLLGAERESREYFQRTMNMAERERIRSVSGQAAKASRINVAVAGDPHTGGPTRTEEPESPGDLAIAT